MDSDSSLFQELKSRRFLRSIGLYVVASWVILQVAALTFPGIHVHESAIRYVWAGVILGFPIALLFAWRYNVSSAGVLRTVSLRKPVDISLNRSDHLVIGSMAAILLIIVGFVAINIYNARVSPASESALVDTTASIAVLPFNNMSGDRSNDPFTVGLHDDLLTHIARLSEIRVISRTSVDRLSTTLTIPEIGRLLGVSTVLEGGVQRYGDRMRINAQLIDAATDQHVWSEQFDRTFSLENMFAIQTEIAAAIAQRLQITFTPGTRDQMRRDQPSSLDAYTAYLLGRERMVIRTRESLLAAAEKFDEAIRLDPDYALAYVGLADTNLLLNNYGVIPLADALEVATPALERALELDGQLGPAHASMGLSLAQQGDFAAAEQAYRRAIRLEPNYAAPYNWLAHILVNWLDRPIEAVPLLQKARILDPLSPVILVTQGEASLALGRFDAALSHFEQAIDIDSASPAPYFLTAEYHRAVRGDLVSAYRWYLKEIEIDPDRDTTAMGFVSMDLGDIEMAEHWFSRAREILSDESYWPRSAEVVTAVYHDDEALALDRARALHRDFPGDNAALWALVWFEQYQEAVDAFAPFYPGLSCDADVVVTRRSLAPAINLSLAYEQLGFTDCAARLLDRALDATTRMPRMGNYGFGLADVEIHARQGNTELALKALREAVDANHRSAWWILISRGPHTVSIRDETEVVELSRMIEADMARQLAEVNRLLEEHEMDVR